MKVLPQSVSLLLEEVRQKLDLFATLEFGGGGVRTLLACYPLLHEWPGLQRRIEALSFSPEAVRLLSSWNINPVGRVLALHPWRDPDEIILRLTTETVAEVLNDVSVWNQMHLNWVLTTAHLVSRLCMLHGVDGTFRIADATFIHRAWQMSIHLTAVGSFGGDFFNARLQALFYLESIDPKITQRVNQNSLSLTIKRKKATSLEERYERMGLARDVKERRKLLSLAVRYDEDYYLPPPLPMVSKKIMQAEAKARAYAQIEESPIPRPGGPGQVAFRRILATCRSTQTHASALVATMAVAMLAPGQIMQADVQICDGFATISTRANRSFTTLNGFDSALHLKSDDHFRRVLPLTLANRFVEARDTHGGKGCLVEMTKFLHPISDRATINTFLSALLYQGPLWMGYPSTYPRLGLTARHHSMPGWAYYSHFDLQSNWTAIAAYMSLICDSSEIPQILPPPFVCGSHCTPRDEVVREMAARFGILMTEGLPSDPDALICKWDALIGLFHPLFVGHTFLRNYPLLPPAVLENNGAFDTLSSFAIITQKNPVVTWYAPPLRELLRRVRQKWSEYQYALRDFGIEIDFRSRDDCAYGFWTLPTEIRGVKTSAYQIPRRALCTNGLLHWPAVEHLAGLHPNAMRHWNVSSLLNSGEFSLAEVNRVCGHGTHSSQPLSSDSREPGHDPTKERAFWHLASISKLVDIL